MIGKPNSLREKVRAKVRAKGHQPTEDYATRIALLEYDEAKLWKGVRKIEPGDTSKGARLLKAQHSRAVQGVLLEHRLELQQRAGAPCQ